MTVAWAELRPAEFLARRETMPVVSVPLGLGDLGLLNKKTAIRTPTPADSPEKWHAPAPLPPARKPPAGRRG
jgi:hypothetical protein